MKKSQKPTKSKPKAAKPPKPAPKVKELSEDDLDRVSGGVGADYFLKLDGIKGESQKLVPAVSVGNVSATQGTVKLIKFF
jgi:hypothetical protein